MWIFAFSWLIPICFFPRVWSSSSNLYCKNEWAHYRYFHFFAPFHYVFLSGFFKFNQLINQFPSQNQSWIRKTPRTEQSFLSLSVSHTHTLSLLRSFHVSSEVRSSCFPLSLLLWEGRKNKHRCIHIAFQRETKRVGGRSQEGAFFLVLSSQFISVLYSKPKTVNSSLGELEKRKMSPYTRLGLQAFFTAVFTTTDLLRLLLLLPRTAVITIIKSKKREKNWGKKNRTQFLQLFCLQKDPIFFHSSGANQLNLIERTVCQATRLRFC